MRSWSIFLSLTQSVLLFQSRVEFLYAIDIKVKLKFSERSPEIIGRQSPIIPGRKKIV